MFGGRSQASELTPLAMITPAIYYNVLL